ncbi:MAG: AI-2E family transporter, partial [Alphaproteobacteria bacterium]|nr:AI-2E family transporter [Alphaproteobacteria bacterium]
MPQIEDRVFIGFVIAATLAMMWIASPFFGAILWGLVAAIVFMPVNHQLQRALGGHRNTAAGLTLILILALVIVPAVIIGSLLLDEAVSTYQGLAKDQIDIGAMLETLRAAAPRPVLRLLNQYSLTDIAGLEERLSTFLTSALRIAAERAVDFTQSAFGFAVGLGIMLYLTYFFLRDGRQIAEKVSSRLPLHDGKRRALFEKFTTVIRATVKGSIVVGVVQGILGGLSFYLLDIHAPLLWGVVMGLLSLVPAIGTGLVWVPVGIYLLATGDTSRGMTLLFIGFFIISMVDNILRPILVGKDTRMPDYVVLIATLGGISVLGMNGLIIGPVIAAMFIAAWDIYA